MQVGDVPTFSNVRARLQRLRDAKLFSGWVSRLTPKELIVNIDGEIQNEQDETFSVEVFGTELTARLTGKCLSNQSGQIRLSVQGSIAYGVASESARVRVEGCEVSVQYADGVVTGKTTDVSLSGAGIVTNEALPANTKGVFRISTPSGSFQFTGKVCYSRSKPSDRTRYRLGLHFDQLTRIDAARWRAFVTLHANSSLAK